MKKVYIIKHSERLNGSNEWVDWISCAFTSRKKALEHLAFYEQVWIAAGEIAELEHNGERLYCKNDKKVVFEDIVELCVN